MTRSDSRALTVRLSTLTRMLSVDLTLIVTAILFRPTEGTGHYTQMVWATTEEIGCGQVYYQSNCRGQYQEDEFYETLVVCNYAKAGNYLSKQPRKKIKLQSVSVNVQDLRCTKLERPVLTVQLASLVMTVSVLSSTNLEQ